MKMRKLYILDPERGHTDQLEEFFLNRPNLHVVVSGYDYTRAQFLNSIHQVKEADILLVSASLPDYLGVDVVKDIKKDSSLSHLKTIVTINKNTMNLSGAAIEHGADRTLQVPFGTGALLELINELVPLDGMKEEPASMDDDEEPTKPRQARRPMFDMMQQKNPILEAINQEDPPIAFEPNLKKTVVYTSTGGSGKTTLLVNTAYTIWKHATTKPSICIVDLDLLFPSVVYKFLEEHLIPCEKDIYYLVEESDFLDEVSIKKALIEHEPTGIQILNTPINPESIHKSGMVKAEHIEKILVHLQQMFDIILIDTSTNITDDTTLYPLQACDQSVLVFEPDLASLLSTRKFLYVLKEIEKSPDTSFVDKMLFVLNKENQTNTLHNDTITELLYGHDVNLRIPEDTAITHYANNGEFIADKPSTAAFPVFELSKRLYPIDGKANRKKTGKSFSLSSLPSPMSFLSRLTSKKKK